MDTPSASVAGRQVSGTVPPPLRCWAEINLAALERNLRQIRAALPAHIRYVSVV
jgi:hypothetical protein